jgi:hypothetical protein
MMEQKFHNQQLNSEVSMTIEPMSREGKILLFQQLMES